MDEAARANAGISDSLLRLSVGIEDVEDLIDDITSALDTAAAGVLVTSLSASRASENEGHPAVVK
jgi:hypothetical protein